MENSINWFGELGEGEVSTDWSNIKLVDKKEFIMRQRNRMIFKELVVNTDNMVVIDDYLDETNVKERNFYSRGVEFLKDLINYELNITNRTVEDLLTNKTQTYQDLYDTLGLEPFTVMMVRSHLAKSKGNKYLKTVSDYERIIYAGVPTKLRKREDVKGFIDSILRHSNLPEGVKIAVVNYVDVISKNYGTPIMTKSLLGYQGYMYSAFASKLFAKSEKIKTGIWINELELYNFIKKMEDKLIKFGVDFNFTQDLPTPENLDKATPEVIDFYSQTMTRLATGIYTKKNVREEIANYFDVLYKFYETN